MGTVPEGPKFKLAYATPSGATSKPTADVVTAPRPPIVCSTPSLAGSSRTSVSNAESIPNAAATFVAVAADARPTTLGSAPAWGSLGAYANGWSPVTWPVVG